MAHVSNLCSMAEHPAAWQRSQSSEDVTPQHPRDFRTVYGEYGSFRKLGVTFWGANHKDCCILGSILGFPYIGKLPYFEVEGLVFGKCNTIHRADMLPS